MNNRTINKQIREILGAPGAPTYSDRRVGWQRTKFMLSVETKEQTKKLLNRVRSHLVRNHINRTVAMYEQKGFWYSFDSGEAVPTRWCIVTREPKRRRK